MRNDTDVAEAAVQTRAMPPITTREQLYRSVIEQAGAVFLRLENDCVLFQSSPSSKRISLYALSCDAENVRLALKAERERLLIDAWEPLL